MAKETESNPQNDKLKALQAAMSKIEKDFGKGAIMRMGDKQIEDVEVISTGSIALNVALGIGGYPRGRIIEIYGPESSGKTTLALHAIAEVQKKGGIAAFIDAEHAFDSTYAAKLGVDVDNLWVSQPDNGEQALQIVDVHEELESLVKNYPTIKQARFWMTFGKQYLNYLDVIQQIGMARIDAISYEAPLTDDPTKTAKVNIVPLQFLKAVLPNPQDLGENYDGETSIGCRIRGVKDGKERTYYVYNNCKHQDAYQETGMQGVSYTTGVPAMIGAMMFVQGIWKRPGVWNVEEFDPDPFMEQLNIHGLPWNEEFDIDLEV